MTSGGGRRQPRTAIPLVVVSIALVLVPVLPVIVVQAATVQSPTIATSLDTPDDSLDRAFDRAARLLVAALEGAIEREKGAATPGGEPDGAKAGGDWALEQSGVLALAATGYGAQEAVRSWLRAREAARPDAGWAITLYDHWLQTSDHDLIRAAWPAVRDLHERAVAGDDDGDGLPDASARDIHHAALWIEALRAVADLAGALGEMRIARVASQQFERAWSALERRYYSRERGGYLRMPRPEVRIGADGAARDTGDIALPVLALALSLLESDRVDATLERLASERSEPHRASAALMGTALYTYHRSGAGLEMLRADARAAAGAGRAGGRDSTEAASALMLSLFRGLLGLRPDAPREFLVWAPHLPADWDSLELRDYRIGSSRLDLSVTREVPEGSGGDRGERRSALTARFHRRGARSLGLRFAPALPAASVPRTVELDGEPVEFERARAGDEDLHVSVRFRLRDHAVVRITYEPGPGPQRE